MIMTFQSPQVNLEQKSNVSRDEWWGLILLFVVWVVSQVALDRAISSCRDSGGLAKVESWAFSLMWKVECYKNS
ncbi:hypothetical protein [Paenibacillus sedimenti]|uniref:Uncharacterized protein n=1 Tax=Paenibacillus sedimenti TaxID=2770274 RepID=A0A926KKR6_9BACL|nr:hypothetical protein [Paenibacillus sedimenti]MBD0379607.1 hypothetical protein [Paenibacillus sedimenti]